MGLSYYATTESSLFVGNWQDDCVRHQAWREFRGDGTNRPTHVVPSEGKFMGMAGFNPCKPIWGWDLTAGHMSSETRNLWFWEMFSHISPRIWTCMIFVQKWCNNFKMHPILNYPKILSTSLWYVSCFDVFVWILWIKWEPKMLLDSQKTACQQQECCRHHSHILSCLVKLDNKSCGKCSCLPVV